MQRLSTSLTLGKASSPHGANVEHNRRDSIASNVDVNRICANVVYVKQDVEDVYAELFGESVSEYNAKQKQPCRRISDYFAHISESKREEAFYELVVQFGDMKTAGIGSPNGEIAVKMLDEYIRSFRARNPNLYIFGANLHMDEKSPHLHIDFIPFYTQGRKNGLSKGVSMKAALIEQGFNPKGKNQNQLVMWQDSERKVMEMILRRYGFERDVKNADYAHQSVPEYKKSQDAKRLLAFARSNEIDMSIENVEQLRQDKRLLEVEKEKLLSQKSSPWKSFFYTAPDKQAFVQLELDHLNIPYRETENGFEAQEHFVSKIRKIEKAYKPKENPHRKTLRDILDRVVMQSKTFDEVLERLRESGCEVKRGKYLAVRPRYATNFIRTKSIGEDYSEQALRNRLVYKQKFESDIDVKTQSTKPDSLEYMTLKTIRHYTIVFSHGVLPVRKKNKKRPFEWTNCEELDRLAKLNKKINSGVTIESLRSDFGREEKSVTKLEEQIATLKTDTAFFNKLFNTAIGCFVFGSYNLDERELLKKHNVTSKNYERIEKLIADSKDEIGELERLLSVEQTKLKDAADTVALAEKVMSGTLVQSFVEDDKQRRQSELIENGIKSADGSDWERIETVAKKILEAEQAEEAEPVRRGYGGRK